MAKAHDDDDGHDHDHGHRDQPAERVNRRPLAIAFAITIVFLIAEVIGGLLTNSLALLADAGHMATDVAALALALFAVWLARRPATPERSFGFYRAEVLAALVNAATLVAISFYIFWEAWQRIGEPPEVDSGPMLAVAIAGLGANAASAWVLMRGGGHEHNLNTRGAFLHVIGDMLGSVGAIAAALVMLVTGWYLADPILSAGIGGLILWSSWRLLRESVEVLLETAPRHLDVTEVCDALRGVAGVADVHDIHVWTVTSGLVAMSGHVEVSGMRPWTEVLPDLAKVLQERFDIAHATLQPEASAPRPGAFRSCSLASPDGHAACRVPATADRQAGARRGHQH
jgi:cobalt-zinc-cadmium efflux system protein